jgi:hypothetical protein
MKNGCPWQPSGSAIEAQQHRREVRVIGATVQDVDGL